MIIAYKYGRKKYTQRQARRAQEAQSIAPADPGQAPTTNNQPTSQNAPSSAIQPVVHQSPQQDVKLCQHQLAQDPSNQSNSSKCEICRREKHDARIYRWKLIVGLLAPYLLASLDLTIVATALPFIASHFGKYFCCNSWPPPSDSHQTNSTSLTGSSLPTLSPPRPSSLHSDN